MSRPTGPSGSGPDDIDCEVRQAFLAHGKAVQRSALRATRDHAAAEDSAQQAFIEAAAIWTRFRQWPPGKQRAWLCRTARCRVIDSWRATGAEVPTETLPDERVSGSAEDIVMSALALDRFWTVVRTMPPRAARVAYLRWHERWTMTDVAKHLGIDRATATRDLNSVLTAVKEQAGDQIALPVGDDSKEA